MFELPLLLLASRASPPPSIVHVVMDDIGWNDLGFVNPLMLTPQIDRLATTDGLLLTHFYTAKECAPTRGALMTGRAPYHFGYYRNPSDDGGVPLEYKLLPQILASVSSAQYATHAVGKWHLGFKTKNHTATYRGFESWMGYYHWGEDYFSHAFPPAYKGEVPCRGVDFNDNVGQTLTPEPTKYKGVYSLDVFKSKIDSIISSHVERYGLPAQAGSSTSASIGKPLFLYAAWQNCHDPYDVPQKYHLRGEPKYIDLYPHVHDLERRNMSAMISALDEGIGDTVASLRASGLWPTTLMVAHTDNGGELPYASGGKPGVPNENGGAGNNFPLRGGKFTLWEGGIRGHAFVSGGALPVARRGKRYSALVSVVDWYTTYASMANVPASALKSTGPRPLDGVDLSEAILSSGERVRTEIVHKPLNQWWTGKCSAGDLQNRFRPACGAAIVRWPYKLLFGYAGDNRTFPLPATGAAFQRVSALHHEAEAATVLSQHGYVAWNETEQLIFAPPSGAPCVTVPCLYDLSKDPNEDSDLASSMTALVAELVDALHKAGASGYPPVPGSDGTPTGDAECEMVKRTGSWQPWV